jgi:PAS domain S-box-containing protein
MRPVAIFLLAAVAIAVMGGLLYQYEPRMDLSLVQFLAALAAAGVLVAAWWRSERRALSLRLREAEQRARALEEHFAMAGRFINDSVFLLDEQGRILEANDRAEAAFGYSRGELTQMTVFDLRPAGAPEIEEARAHIANIRAGRYVPPYTSRFRRKDGRQVVVEISPRFIGVDGRSLIQSIVRDVTDRVEAERALRLSEERYRVLAEISPVGIFRTEANGRTVYVNSRAAQICGLSVQQCLSVDWASIIHPEDRARAGAAWRACVADPDAAPFLEEFRIVRPDGSISWVLSQASVERGPAGEPTAFVGTLTDVTALKAAQQALQEAREHLEERVVERTRELEVARDEATRADRVKTAFLSTVSHELRTPLNSILGFTDVILQGLSGPLSDGQQRQLSIVRDSAAHLRALIEDVLDISRIEAGQMGLDIGPVDLRDLLERRTASFETEAKRKNLALSSALAPDLGVIVSDGKRVAQIVNNLLSNAVKFTAAGSVRLAARRSGGRVEIEVCDTGPGIDAQDLDKLFRPFSQVMRPGGRVPEGTGLGLAISRQLAIALGGNITVDSEPGRGSTFRLVLPNDAPVRDQASVSGIYKRPAAAR